MSETAAHTFLAEPRWHGHRDERILRCRSVVLWALVLALPSLPPAYAASTTWNAGHENDAIVVRASALLDADVHTAWRVLTDYPRYSQFIPGVQRSAVVRRDGGWVVVDESLSLPLCVLRVPVDVTWRIAESPPDALHSRASADQASIDSQYVLTPLAAGVRLDYVGRLIPSGALRLLGCAPGERIMAAGFDALAAEIEREYRQAHP
jgi:polyketide cyclase/dehydrase/lipid transport protein